MGKEFVGVREYMFTIEGIVKKSQHRYGKSYL
jgi:hypothetical protein